MLLIDNYVNVISSLYSELGTLQNILSYYYVFEFHRLIIEIALTGGEPSLFKD